MHGFPGEASESAGVFARWSRPRSARYCSVQRVTRLPLPQPCGFEGLVVTLRFLADGPAQGGDGLFGVYCHEHCKLLKMTVCWSLFPVLSCAELCWHGIVLCL
mmetsp:Transcript_52533/g.137775  ORF Transcript_52533/g.137775 Transcript_52533/m.137775 type:complete len:103 (+) Transcript_52533:2709-3017(+)